MQGRHYSSLSQIDTSNVRQLQARWAVPMPGNGIVEAVPLVVDGVMYTTGAPGQVFALDARTGRQVWRYQRTQKVVNPYESNRVNRGVAVLGNRVFAGTLDGALIALDLRTGALLWELQVADTLQGYSITSAPLVVKDKIVTGVAGGEYGIRGFVDAYDPASGNRLWRFYTIPGPGEFGHDTWEGDSWKEGSGATWLTGTFDPELNTLFWPVGNPGPDINGDVRKGDNLFTCSVLALDPDTGQRKWHYQLVHHPLWDMDISSAPILADINVNGRAIKAVAQPTKQGFLYVFDRVTGLPVWPIEERPVEKGNVPGEWYSPTQPFPLKPPSYARNGVAEDDLINFTPAMRDQALTIISKYKIGPVFTPPVESKLDGPLATLTLGTASGGTNWPGGSYDPETHIVYAFACNACLTPIGLVKSPKDVSDMNYIAGTAGQEPRMRTGPGENAGADSPLPSRAPAPARGGGSGYVPLTVQGLPLIKPPYATISAINLDKGEIIWQVAHGETPDSIRNHSGLKGLDIPRTGQAGYSIGTLITKTLVIAGDSQVTTTNEHSRGAMLRAYDKATGKEVGTVLMPAPQSGSPMTYMLNGKQYIVVAVSGGPYSGEYIAFTLPSTDEHAETR